LLSLTLLMSGILADDPHGAMAPDDLALSANALDRSPHFHSEFSIQLALLGSRQWWSPSYLAR
jgi:hypothetical protein